MLKKVTVYLVSRTSNIDNDILAIIKGKHGAQTVIKAVTSPPMLNTPFGFSNLLQRRRLLISKNTACVYAIKGDLNSGAFENASTTGIPFGVLFRNADKQWDSVLLEGRVGATA